VQYKSAIWPQNEAQEAAARASKKAIEDKYNKTLHTDIEPPKTWCVPEGSTFLSFFFAPTAPRARALASARG
jgi:peptide methionine sulfoxide reductase MsrA